MRTPKYCAPLLLHSLQLSSAFTPGHVHLVKRTTSRGRIQLSKSPLTTVSESRSAATAFQENIIHSDETLEILSHDPLVYLVHIVLSPEECQSYIDRVGSMSEETDLRFMTTSNPAEVSLDVKKLWPLPFLSIMAGIPSVMRQLEISEGISNISWGTIAMNATPAVGWALLVSLLLALAAVPLLQTIFAPAARTSEAISLNQVDDLNFIRPLVERACRITGNHPWQCFEAPVVTRYRTGAVFGLHNDASPTRGSEWSTLGAQRVVTAIFYLSTCANGGATRFDRLGFEVQPRQGSALVFSPADKQTLKADDRTRHESMPAVDEKWIVQMFGRIGPRVPSPLGIPDAFDKIIYT